MKIYRKVGLGWSEVGFSFANGLRETTKAEIDKLTVLDGRILVNGVSFRYTFEVVLVFTALEFEGFMDVLRSLDGAVLFLPNESRPWAAFEGYVTPETAEYRFCERYIKQKIVVTAKNSAAQPLGWLGARALFSSDVTEI